MAIRAVDAPPWPTARPLTAADRMQVTLLNAHIGAWTTIRERELGLLAATPWWKPWRVYRLGRALAITERCLSATRAAHDALRWG